MAPQPRRDHAAVIGDEKVARPQKRANFTKPAVLDAPCGPFKYEQTAAVARLSRLLGR